MSPDDLSIGAHYRHKKTGGTYQLMMFATIEATMVEAVIYGARKDGEVHRWACGFRNDTGLYRSFERR